MQVDFNGQVAVVPGGAQGSAMKLPRWLLIGLWTAIVLGVLAAAGWWWVTWPERTAREFVELVADGKLEVARRRLYLEPDTIVSQVHTISAWENTKMEGLPRSAGDMLRRRQKFFVVESEYVFLVEGDKVIGPDPVFRKRISRESLFVRQP